MRVRTPLWMLSPLTREDPTAQKPDVPDSGYLSISDAKEIESLVEELPIAVDQKHFTYFVLGFIRTLMLVASSTRMIQLRIVKK